MFVKIVHLCNAQCKQLRIVTGLDCTCKNAYESVWQYGYR